MIYEDEIIQMEFANGILIGRYKKDVYVDIDQAKHIVKQRLKMTGGKPHCALATGGPLEMSPEARKYALSKESSQNIECWAVVYEQSLFKSVFLKLLFFTQGKWNRIRFFDTEEEGMAWLTKQADERMLSGSFS